MAELGKVHETEGLAASATVPVTAVKSPHAYDTYEVPIRR